MDGTFDAADLNKDGRIDFAEYEVMVTENPNIMKPITLNVSEILAATRLATGAAAGGK